MKYIVALLCLLLSFTTAFAGPLPDAPHIATTGSYSFSSVPDTLNLSLQIFEVGRDVEQARSVVEQRSHQLITLAKELGIDKKDINSASLTISPRFNWNNNQQIYSGTEVSRRIELTLKDLSKYDALLQGILATKIVRINSSRLSSSQESELEAKALQGAVADARKRAELLVTDLSQKVGDVFSISTANTHYPAPSNAMYRTAEAQTSKSAAFEPGSLTTSKSVQVVFYLVKK